MCFFENLHLVVIEINHKLSQKMLFSKTSKAGILHSLAQRNLVRVAEALVGVI